jgi:hypothetical protein
MVNRTEDRETSWTATLELRDSIISGDANLGHTAINQHLRITKYARTGVSHTFTRKKLRNRLRVGKSRRRRQLFRPKKSREPSRMRQMLDTSRCSTWINFTPLKYAHSLSPIVGSEVHMDLIRERILLPNCNRRNVVKIAIHNSNNFRCGFL